MGKKKSNAVTAARQLESKVSPILEINYSDPLFAIAAHPTRSIIAQGLATGHVFCSQYDAEKLEELQQERREEIMDELNKNFKKGKISQVVKSVSQSKKKWWEIIDDHAEFENANISTLWKTKRHKGSCRSILFDPLENSLGENLYTAGTDHIIKKANTETGKVTSKGNVKDHFPGKNEAITKICHSATHPFLLAGTENGHILVYDSSNLGKNELKFKVSNAHDDAINHIMAMPAVSAYQYLTLGSTTLSHIDIRKGIITQSDDQEDELLSMCYATDHVNDNKNDTVLVAQGEGVVTIWKDSKNKLMDQLTRVKVNKGVSIDTIIPTMNNETEEMTNSVWCGDSEGLLHRINYKIGKIVETRVHSVSKGKYGAVDEVGNLDIDYNYRLISAGMDSLKIWSEQTQEDVIESEDESDESDDSDSEDLQFSSDSDGEGSEEENEVEEEEIGDEDEESEGEEDFEDEESDEEGEDEAERLNSLRKRLNKSKPKRKLIDLNSTSETPIEQEKKKPKSKQLTNKQLRNMQQHEHGIRKFEGL